MKLVQLTFQKTVQKSALIVVEVPDNYPEESIESFLTKEKEKIETSVNDDWDENYSNEPLIKEEIRTIDAGDGSPHFRLENDVLVNLR